MKSPPLLLALLLSISTLYLQAGNQGNARPNIVIILTDDLGYSDFGCYGGEIQTPNIDRLAESGLRFADFHAEAKCNPSRQTLLTGKYFTKAYLGRDATIAECLAPAGYASYISGKWDMVADIPGDSRTKPQLRGFDHFYGTPMGCGSFFAPIMLSRDGQPAEQESMKSGYYYTDAISDNAITYIKDTPEDTPVFLYVSYTAPHWPLHAMEEDIAKYKGRFALGWDKLREQRLARMKEMGLVGPDVPLSARESTIPAWKDEQHQEWQQRRMEVYAAQVDRVDQGVGRILDTLKATRRFNNTLIFVSSDNGGCPVEYTPNRTGNFLNEKTRDGRPLKVGNVPGIMPGPEDTWQSYGRNWAFLSNTPLRRGKGEEYEGGNRVPMIVHWPGVIKNQGGIVHDTSHFIDVLPTVLNAAGITYPDTFMGRKVSPPDGASLMPLLSGKSWNRHEYLFWEFAQKKAVRSGKWKLVYPRGGPWELYNIENDPIESRNWADDYPELVERLSKQWDEWYSIVPAKE